MLNKKNNNPRNLAKLSKLLEYGVMAWASEDPKLQISVSEATGKTKIP